MNYPIILYVVELESEISIKIRNTVFYRFILPYSVVVYPILCKFATKYE